MYSLENCSRPAIFIFPLLETGEGPGRGEPVPEQGIAVLEGTQLERSLDGKGREKIPQEGAGRGVQDIRSGEAGSPVSRKRGLKPDCQA